MNISQSVAELFDFAFSRRNVVQGSVGGGNPSLATPAGLGRAFAQELTDVDILQFALGLEHLEARMYKDMLAANILTGKELRYFQSFGSQEAAHVTFLTDALAAAGASPVQAQTNYNFPTFNSREAILDLARIAEETGVGAYQGAAAAIQNKDYLAAAGSIVQVEARHAAIVRLLLGQKPVPAATTPSLTIAEVNAIVGPILGS
jgi:hypothetical protein